MTASMSKSRAKKLRKRARRSDSDYVTETPSTPDGVDDTVPWYSVSGEERANNLFALKVEVLGPFLFSQPSLCEQAMKYGRELKLLPVGSQTWPVFFGKEKWEQVQLLVQVTLSTIKLCEKDSTFCDQLMKPGIKEENLSNPLLCERVYTKSRELSCYSLSEVQPIFTLFTIQVADFATRTETSNPGQLLIESSSENDTLMGPVKTRGNTNFKQQRFKAAIADYTTAIKLCPHNHVLYCNRALCYLRNNDYWCSCLDSYRALVLKPRWEKPYYRCAEAWSKLGDFEKALVINRMGQGSCSNCSELLRQVDELQLSLEKKSEPASSDSVPSKKKPLPSPEISKSENPKPKPNSPKISTKKTPPLNETKLPTPTTSNSEKTKENEKEKKKDTSDGAFGNVDAGTTSKEPVAEKKSKKKSSKSSKSSTTDSLKKTKPFTDFEILQCPTLGAQISCKQLRELCSKVKLQSCSPNSYFVQGSAWESLEPKYVPPRKPETDPMLRYKPVSVVFDEIWCPVLSDMPESKYITPPKYHYLAQMRSGDYRNF